MLVYPQTKLLSNSEASYGLLLRTERLKIDVGALRTVRCYRDGGLRLNRHCQAWPTGKDFDNGHRYTLVIFSR